MRKQLAGVLVGVAVLAGAGSCTSDRPTAPATEPAAAPPPAVTPVAPAATPHLDLGGSAGLGIPVTVLDFGEVQVGAASAPQSVNVTNLSAAPILMTGAGGNPGGQFTGAQSCQGLSLVSGSSCQLIFNFLPTAEGPATAVSSGTWNGQPFNITLRGVGVGPRLSINPSGLDFGFVATGAASKADTAVVTNVGRGPVTMSGAGGNPGGQFTGAQSCQGLTLPVGGHCYLIYNFVPTATGAATSVSAGTWNGAPFHVDLVGTGIASGSSPSALFRISHTALDFGDVPIGTTSKADTAVVTNISAAPVIMSGAGGNPGGQFTGAQSCQGLTLAPGGSCYLIYNFVPTAAGLDSSVSAGTWNGQPFNVKLRGNAVLPQLHIDPSGLDFGDVQIGSVSKADTAVVTNVGPSPVTMNGAGGNPGGQFTGAQSCQGLTLAPGASCYLIYNFLPTAAGLDSSVSAGTWNGAPFSVTLRGNGVAPQLLISPAGFDFGQVTVGSASALDSAVITNTGVAPLQMSGAGGNPGAPFTGAQSCQGLTLAVGASCALIYGLQPTAAGPASATSAGSWNGQSYSIPLEGVGVQPVLQETMELRPRLILLRTRIPVLAVLLSTPSFDPTAIPLASIRMLVNGTTDVAPAEFRGSPIVLKVDLNRDRVKDLVITFNLPDLVAAGLTKQATSGSLVLHGTINGQNWQATDPVLPKIR
jgi:hypothetical protein